MVAIPTIILVNDRGNKREAKPVPTASLPIKVSAITKPAGTVKGPEGVDYEVLFRPTKEGVEVELNSQTGLWSRVIANYSDSEKLWLRPSACKRVYDSPPPLNFDDCSPLSILERDLKKLLDESLKLRK